MRMNLSSLRIEVSETHIGMRIATSAMRKDDRAPRRWHFTIAEKNHIIAALRGEASFYPFFDDGIHLIKMTPRGAREVSTSRETWISSLGLYFTFPGDWLADKLEDLVALQREWGHEVIVIVGYDELRELRESVAPVISWEYHGNTESDIYAARHNPLVDSESLEMSLSTLERHAENLSDGKEVIIHLRDDTYGDREVKDWFWYFEREGRQVGLHGGLIAHQDKNGNWTYSTHT